MQTTPLDLTDLSQLSAAEYRNLDIWQWLHQNCDRHVRWLSARARSAGMQIADDDIRSLFYSEGYESLQRKHAERLDLEGDDRNICFLGVLKAIARTRVWYAMHKHYTPFFELADDLAGDTDIEADCVAAQAQLLESASVGATPSFNCAPDDYSSLASDQAERDLAMKCESIRSSLTARQAEFLSAIVVDGKTREQLAQERSCSMNNVYTVLQSLRGRMLDLLPEERRTALGHLA